MSDLVENRGDAQYVPRHFSPTRGVFARPAGFGKVSISGSPWRGLPDRRGAESKRVAPGQTSQKTKPGINLPEAARYGDASIRYDADRCAFKKFKMTGDGQIFFRNNENRMQFLAVQCKSARFEGRDARSNLVQVSPGKKNSRGPIAIASSISGSSRVFMDGGMICRTEPM